MSGPKRALQAVDNNANPLTNVPEGSIVRWAVPDDGKWHLVPRSGQAVRLHVFKNRKGVLYTQSKAAAVVEGDAVADHVVNSLPLDAGAIVILTFSGQTDLFLAADPDASGAAPLVGVCQPPEA